MVQTTPFRSNKWEMEEELERMLISSLSPVEPDTAFLNRLKERFERQPTTVLEHQTFWGIYLIIATGLFIGIFSFWVALRISGSK